MMSKREHRVYFSSAFCESDSKLGRFIVNLPVTLDFSYLSKCAIRDIFISSEVNSSLNSIYILGDFCETSFLHKEEQLPVLSKVYINNKEKYYILPDPLYIPLKQNHLRTFELQFLNSNLEPINFGEEYLIECTLHFYCEYV